MAEATTELLATRQNTHGFYAENATITQHTLRMWEMGRNWPTLSNMQKEALHMFAHKIARVLTGNPNEKDHWDDIAGYAKLVSMNMDNTEIFNGNELYAVIARGMDISREEAKRRFPPEALMAATSKHLPPKTEPKTGPEVPGTPADGGQHGSIFLTDEEMDAAIQSADGPKNTEAVDTEITNMASKLSSRRNAIGQKQD